MEELIPAAGSTGTWAAIGSALALLVGGGYKAIRMIKGDIRDDKQNESFDKYRDSLLARIKELEDRTDKLATERNSAIGSVGRLEAEVRNVNERMLEFRKQRDEEFSRLTSDNDRLRSQVQHLIELVGVDTTYMEALENARQSLTGRAKRVTSPVIDAPTTNIP